ncbi:MAG: hypothetical protein M9953_05540 [Thermomicrobiales bacterium]|nr:hypothetical protein [Thermomicrobiales bacterium]
MFIVQTAGIHTNKVVTISRLFLGKVCNQNPFAPAHDFRDVLSGDEIDMLASKHSLDADGIQGIDQVKAASFMSPIGRTTSPESSA